MKIARIKVEGIVQGVGFRPNIYRLATALKLNGYVKNLGNIVEIVVSGDESTINQFLGHVKRKTPPIAKINNMEVEWSLKTKTNELNIPSSYKFQIYESSDEFSGTSVIPADIATCNACLDDINNSNSSRYEYPFTACTDCGPRFTVIESVPYDRDKTTMEKFPLCNECMIEYTNPLDRRYHAEASCCIKCGPELSLFKNNWNITHKNKNKKKKMHQISNIAKIKTKTHIQTVAELLDNGQIIAIKGIGGTHLVANAADEIAIKTMRKRLNRFNQPFAVMSKDVETIKNFAKVSNKEKKVITSNRRPIVVLKKSKDYSFPEELSPELHTIGVMLPYVPLQNILFNYTKNNAYIMTSANMPGEPMMIENTEIIENLSNIADYFLVHNRKIANRCDDSVVRFRGNDLSFIRRSRGYTPEPYDLIYLNNSKNSENSKNPKKPQKTPKNILSLGPELDVTFAITKSDLKSNLCYVSQHIGNTNKFRTYEFLKDAIKNLMEITKTNNFDIITHDLHPQFFTTKLANELADEFNCETKGIQHHHAHAAALACDNKVDELICIAADGVGYGDDGNAWGGEILYSDISSYQRLGALRNQKMPGGDISTKYPVRILASILSNVMSIEELKKLLKEDYVSQFPHRESEIDLLITQLNKNFNTTLTSSTGRVLDSIASALEICSERTYEGESAMKLESVAYKGTETFKIDTPLIKETYNTPNGKSMKIPVLDTSFILSEVISKIHSGEKTANIALYGQTAVATGLAKLSVNAANEKGVDIIGGTGGVFYNESISKIIKDYVEKEGFEFIQHKNSCASDGSVALGQSTIISKRYG